CQQGYSYPLTV
nr:immunoglobulin light chain junction region [Macaca mulatta]